MIVVLYSNVLNRLLGPWGRGSKQLVVSLLCVFLTPLFSRFHCYISCYLVRSFHYGLSHKFTLLHSDCNLFWEGFRVHYFWLEPYIGNRVAFWNTYTTKQNRQQLHTGVQNNLTFQEGMREKLLFSWWCHDHILSCDGSVSYLCEIIGESVQHKADIVDRHAGSLSLLLPCPIAVCRLTDRLQMTVAYWYCIGKIPSPSTDYDSFIIWLTAKPFLKGYYMSWGHKNGNNFSPGQWRPVRPPANTSSLWTGWFWGSRGSPLIWVIMPPSQGIAFGPPWN